MKMAKLLAAKFAIIFGAASPANTAGIPVLDGTNLTQNIVTAVEQVTHTIQQIQAYQTQLQQYQNMLTNSIAAAENIWDPASSTISNLVNATNTLDTYKQHLGTIDQYLGSFQDVTYYRQSPCFAGGNCTTQEMAALRENETLAAESQKKANDALFLGLEQQQQTIQDDADRLVQLQAAAQGAVGQRDAIAYGNQLSAAQVNQLLQIRGLLIAQQNAVGTMMQANADDEARRSAADAQFRSGTYTKSPKVEW